jgi:hypothetical protein
MIMAKSKFSDEEQVLIEKQVFELSTPYDY